MQGSAIRLLDAVWHYGRMYAGTIHQKPARIVVNPLVVVRQYRGVNWCIDDICRLDNPGDWPDNSPSTFYFTTEVPT